MKLMNESLNFLGQLMPIITTGSFFYRNWLIVNFCTKNFDHYQPYKRVLHSVVMCSVQDGRPVFQISPQRLELNPGQTAEIVLEGISDMYIARFLLLLGLLT